MSQRAGRGGGGTTAVEVKIVARGAGGHLTARELVVRAQGMQEAFNTEHWYTLVHGTESCRGCSEVRIEQLPIGTQAVSIQADLVEKGALDSVLHLS